MRAALALFVVLLVLGMSGCESSGEDGDPSAPGGLGMTYKGKPGIDLGNGLVMGHDGSVGLGYGF